MRTHTVEQGECLYQIAQKYGVTVDAIWALAENAHLRESHRSPDVLFAGDVVHLPDIRVRTERAATEKRHGFRRKTRQPKMAITFRLLFEDKPRKNVSCKLVLDDLPGPPREIPETTDDDGVVEFDVPLVARSGVLKIGDREFHRVRFSHLDPISEVSGIQQRLASLGYLVRRTGSMDEQTRAALLEFQRVAQIGESGEIDEETVEALKARYGA